MAFFRICIYAVLAFSSIGAYSQLGNRHWLPPVHSRSSEDVEDHYVYLSTPSETPFEVTLRYGTTVISRTISAGIPTSILIGTNKPSPIFTFDSELNTPLDSKGIVLSGSEEFYASFRVRSPAQAGYLTTKGEAALGTSFRLGSLPQSSEVEDKNFFVGIMATEDNTVISISDYNNNVVFEGPNLPLGNTIDIILNEGESYAVSGYTTNPANYDGFIGALVTSDKPIVINTGNGLAGFQANSRDYTIDQIVPVEDVGNEYVVIEGNGNSTTERPMVMATEANTEVFINGALYTTLQNAGDYILIPNGNYQGTSHRNMYITSSKNVYVYQFLAGDGNEATVGMNFIPPLSCFFQKEVDLIPEVDRIGNTTYEGDIIVTTRTGAELTVNGNSISESPENVSGTLDWVTYRLGGYSGNVSVASTQPLAVGLFGFNGSAGFGGYYSGFGSIPKDSETKVCDLVLTELFEQIEGNPDSGGVWTAPGGSGHSGFFDPASDVLGVYNYYLDTGCAIIDVDLEVTEVVAPKNSGNSNEIIVCLESNPLDLFSQLLGTPDTGGVWTDPDGIVFDGVFDPSTFVSGNYTYGFYDNLPCESVETILNVRVSSEPETIEINRDTPLFSNRFATIEVNAEGGLGDYEYLLDGGFWQDEGIFEEVPSGTHTISVRDKNGCGNPLSETVDIVFYPSFFTPNGDNVNETWNIEGLNVSMEAEVFIFDRYGKLLAQIDPYASGWDGLHINGPLPSNDYWFLVNYTENATRKSYKSHFTLKR